jgi:hypothetical protein
MGKPGYGFYLFFGIAAVLFVAVQLWLRPALPPLDSEHTCPDTYVFRPNEPAHYDAVQGCWVAKEDPKMQHDLQTLCQLENKCPP